MPQTSYRRVSCLPSLFLRRIGVCVFTSRHLSTVRVRFHPFSSNMRSSTSLHRLGPDHRPSAPAPIPLDYPAFFTLCQFFCAFPPCRFVSSERLCTIVNSHSTFSVMTQRLLADGFVSTSNTPAAEKTNASAALFRFLCSDPFFNYGPSSSFSANLSFFFVRFACPFDTL